MAGNTNSIEFAGRDLSVEFPQRDRQTLIEFQRARDQPKIELQNAKDLQVDRVARMEEIRVRRSLGYNRSVDLRRGFPYPQRDDRHKPNLVHDQI